MVDEFTRVALATHGAYSITARAVKAVLADLFAQHGAPAVMRSDNGGEFIASEVVDWLAETGTDTFHIAPGKPWQNAFGGVVQRPPARRVPKRARVLEPRACPCAARAFPGRVQHGALAQLARLHDAGRVRSDLPRRRRLKDELLRCQTTGDTHLPGGTRDGGIPILLCSLSSLWI